MIPRIDNDAIEITSAFYRMDDPLKSPPDQGGLGIYLMELGRVELPSALGINLPLIHRFSPSNPRGGRDPLSRITGCSGIFLVVGQTRG
jgi:hypothetical protein